MKRWHTREDSGITLDRELRWWHDGEPIEHPNIIEAFNRGVRAEADGRFTLHFGDDWCFITVEDAAYRIVAIDVSEGERLSVRLSDRTAEWLDPGTLALDDEGILSARVKGARAKARFSREAQFQLLQHLEVDGEWVMLRVGSSAIATSLPAKSVSG